MNAQQQLDEIRTALARVKSEQAGLSDVQSTFAAAVREQPTQSDLAIAAQLAALTGACVLSYHGYKRNNDSIGWGVGWWFLGGFFPIGTAIGAFLAYDKGFAKPIQPKA